MSSTPRYEVVVHRQFSDTERFQINDDLEEVLAFTKVMLENGSIRVEIIANAVIEQTLNLFPNCNCEDCLSNEDEEKLCACASLSDDECGCKENQETPDPVAFIQHHVCDPWHSPSRCGCGPVG